MAPHDLITEVRFYHCSQPMSVSYSTDTRSEMDVLVVEVSSVSHTGWGEVFMPRVEPLWSRSQQIAPLLIGGKTAALDTLIEQWPADRPKMSLAECSTYCHPEVDCVGEAVSIALYDLHARQRGVRFADLLGQIAAPIRFKAHGASQSRGDGRRETHPARRTRSGDRD